MNCEKLLFSQELSDQRISQAETLLSKTLVRKYWHMLYSCLALIEAQFQTF